MPTTIQDARQILIQFSFTNPGHLPKQVREKKEETEAGGEARRQNSSGVPIIHPTERCSAKDLVEAMKAEGLVLTDAFCQKRPNKDTKKPPYWMVRFVFVKAADAKPSDRFKSIQSQVLQDLRRLLSYYWRIRAYDNPHYESGAETGDRVLSINFEVLVVPAEDQKPSAVLQIVEGQVQLA